MERKIKNIVVIIILLACLFFAYKHYKNNEFNNFVMSEKHLFTSDFSRDSEEQYLNKPSYKITSPKYNDAMFYQSINVKKDTPYKITCMVKTKDIESENKLAGSGAQISVEGTTERSVAISGTNDWQQIEMIINSKDREKVNIGFRLGGYVDNCKGEAWFSDFRILEGEKEATNSNWNFACFFFEDLNATVNGENISYSLSEQDISDMRSTAKRFETSIETMSENKMTAYCDIYRVNIPITSVSYDKQYGYYVAPEDVEAQIKDTINANNYDHIFVVFRLGDKEVKDWVGLGGMDYYGIGFSNIRLTNSTTNALYRYDARINTFPEEVFMHEFLHSFERTLNEYGYNIPALHDNEKYGYETQIKEGLKKWYADYLNCNISSSKGLTGLDPIVYALKPAKESNFDNATQIENAFNEPQDFFQEIIQMFVMAGRNIATMFNTFVAQI